MVPLLPNHPAHHRRGIILIPQRRRRQPRERRTKSRFVSAERKAQAERVGPGWSHSFQTTQHLPQERDHPDPSTFRVHPPLPNRDQNPPPRPRFGRAPFRIWVFMGALMVWQTWISAVHPRFVMKRTRHKKHPASPQSRTCQAMPHTPFPGLSQWPDMPLDRPIASFHLDTPWRPVKNAGPSTEESRMRRASWPHRTMKSHLSEARSSRGPSTL